MAWNSEAGKEGQRESSSCRDSFPQPEQNIRTLLLEELENSASSAVPSCETRNGDLGGTCTGRLRAPVHSRSSMPPGWAQWTQQLGETVTSVSVREGNTGPESMKTRKKKKRPGSERATSVWLQEVLLRLTGCWGKQVVLAGRQLRSPRQPRGDWTSGGL